MTAVTEKGAKTLRSVAAFLCVAEWNNENCSEVNVQAQGLGKIFQLWALKCDTC